MFIAARSAYPVLGFLAIMVLAPLGALILTPNKTVETADFWQSTYLRQVLFFSFYQAFVSALLSLGFALLVARAFFHLGDFPFRALLLRIFGIPLIVPAIVAVFSLVSVYGSSGWIPLGADLYGLTGILLAHLFFNIPLAIRLLLPVWQAIPAQHWQLSEQLQFNKWQQWQHLEWPALKENLPGIGLLIYMLCLTSFAVVLTLGGGPKSTTLEVAIYQSLRFDFDPDRAVILALLQLVLCITVALLGLVFQQLPEIEINLNGSYRKRPQLHWLNIFTLAACVTFVSMPMLSMVMDAIKGPVLQVLGQAALWQSAGFSLLIGLLAAAISISGAWLLLRTTSDLAYAGKKSSAAGIELAAQIVYAAPPLVIGTGLFILIAPHFDVFDWAIPLVVIINAMMGLPFAIRTIGPSMRQNRVRYQRLCQSLALSGWNRFKWVDWPMLRRPIGLASALIASLSMGDFGVIALFGTPETTTLPLRLYHQLAAYRFPQAAVTAVVLLCLCLLVFYLLERFIGGKTNA